MVIRNFDMLHDAVACAVIALNVETWLRHGDAGRYKKTTEEDIEKLKHKAGSALPV